MADLYITRVPYIKRILVTELNKYLRTQIHAEELFRRFRNIRVSEDHPFVKLVATQVGIDNVTTSDTDLFPSITVVVTEDRYTANASRLQPIKQVEVGTSQIAHMRQFRKSQYVMSTQEIDRVEQLFNNKPSSLPNLIFEGRETPREASIAVEIWAGNSVVKDKLFDIVLAFFSTFGCLSLRADYGIVLDESSLAGERDGVYNFDFGFKLSGALLRFNLDYCVGQYRAPDSITTLREVIVNMREPSNS